MNHTDWANPTTTKAPLDIQSMAWNWQGGRKFAKIEVTNPAWTSPTFNFHLGSTGCIGNPATGTQVSSCSAPNRMDVKFATFDPVTQKIAVDIKPLLDGTNVTINQAAATGCMSGGTDPECLNVFKALAIDWKADGTGTGLPINGGAAQTLFRTVAK